MSVAIARTVRELVDHQAAVRPDAVYAVATGLAYELIGAARRNGPGG